MTTPTKKPRQSNIELLRIFSMLLIIAHHFSVHGGFNWNNLGGEFLLNINHFISQILLSGGKVGVDIFVIISGYFLIKSNLSALKFIKLLCQIWFYSTSLFLLFTVLGGELVSLKQAVKSFVPVYEVWWFASTYLILYLLSPFINAFLNRLTKAEHLKLLLTFLIIWAILPTVTRAGLAGSSLTWFVTLYSIGAYIRLYDVKALSSKISNWTFIALLTCVTFFAVALADLASVLVSPYSQAASVFAVKAINAFCFAQNSPVAITISVLFFLAFNQLNIGYYKLINTVAATTFGIYLIHDHFFVRKFLWFNVFENASYQNSPYLIIVATIAIISVFVICAAIDWIRLIIFEKLFGSQTITNAINNTQNIVSAKLSRYIGE